MLLSTLVCNSLLNKLFLNLGPHPSTVQPCPNPGTAQCREDTPRTAPEQPQIQHYRKFSPLIKGEYVFTIFPLNPLYRPPPCKFSCIQDPSFPIIRTDPALHTLFKVQPLLCQRQAGPQARRRYLLRSDSPVPWPVSTDTPSQCPASPEAHPGFHQSFPRQPQPRVLMS